ncbi:MAG: zinc ribbon domain-containing protein, partial [Chloroflexi bacterium]|nr:zinc ribbon domain-containing protein [Chloroflexota bacterium]
MIYCPKCGTANRQGSKFCNECGGPLPTTGLRCPMCGAMNPTGNLFCDRCHTRLIPT